MKQIVIIIPAFNEEKRIGETLKEYLKLNIDIIVVLNSCRDNTEQIVKKYPVKYLNFKKAGKGFAIREGFKYALKKNYDLIGFVDADMSTKPESFKELIEQIGEYDGIIGNRWLEGSIVKRTLKRKIMSKGFNYLVRLLFGFEYTDTQAPAKIFKKQALKEIINNLQTDRWEIDIDILFNLKRKNLKIKQIPIIWEDKAGSKIKLSTPIQMFSGVVRLRLLYSPFKFIVKIYDRIPDKYKIYKW